MQVEKRNEEKEKSEGADEDAGVGEDEGEGLERGGTRSSIAERRRLYESRSMSVQEPASPSPTPLRRRDSFKVKPANILILYKKRFIRLEFTKIIIVLDNFKHFLLLKYP